MKYKKSLINYIFEYSSIYKKNYIKSIILAAIGVLMEMIPYFLICRIVKMLMSGEKNFNDYLNFFFFIAIFWVLRVVFHTASTKCSHKATFKVIGNIRKKICDKLSEVPLGTVLNIPSGELKNIIIERTDSMETTLAHIIPEFTANLMAPLMLFFYILFIDWRMAFISLITLPIGLFFFGAMKKDYEVRFGNYINKIKILNDTAVEYIKGIEVIKAFGRSDSSYGKFVTAANEAADSCIDWMRASAWYMAASLSITPETLLVVIPIGGLFVLYGNLSPIDYIEVIILAFGIIRPFITLMCRIDDSEKAGVIFSEVDKLLSLDEMTRPKISKELPIDNSIELKNISFGYGEKDVLKGISLKLPEGSLTALVGPSGSGKSTIARLIASLWDVREGAITIGGINIKDLSVEDYNKKIAYVNQENYLFNLSVRENIRLGRPEASDLEVEEIAKKSGCYDFILSLENGFDTMVGSGGIHLSGGEGQRIAIARAMLKGAPILILDEATAYTDPENEAIIQQSVAKLAKNKTLVVIAHRLSTVKDADQIVVLEKGVIKATGTHEELLLKSELYKRMWEAHIYAKDKEESEEDFPLNGEEIIEGKV